MQTNNWKISLLIGLFAMVLGILILYNPANAIIAIIRYFGIFTILVGVVLLGYGLINTKKQFGWIIRVIEGVINILIGLIILTFPEFSVKLFLTIFGIWAIIFGIMQLFAYNTFRINDQRHGIILINGILSIIIGLILLFNPFRSAVIISIFIGVYAVIYAIFSFITAYRLKNN